MLVFDKISNKYNQVSGCIVTKCEKVQAVLTLCKALCYFLNHVIAFIRKKYSSRFRLKSLKQLCGRTQRRCWYQDRNRTTTILSFLSLLAAEIYRSAHTVKKSLKVSNSLKQLKCFLLQTCSDMQGHCVYNLTMPILLHRALKGVGRKHV